MVININYSSSISSPARGKMTSKSGLKTGPDTESNLQHCNATKQRANRAPTRGGEIQQLFCSQFFLFFSFFPLCWQLDGPGFFPVVSCRR